MVPLDNRPRREAEAVTERGLACLVVALLGLVAWAVLLVAGYAFWLLVEASL